MTSTKAAGLLSEKKTGAMWERVGVLLCSSLAASSTTSIVHQAGAVLCTRLVQSTRVQLHLKYMARHAAPPPLPAASKVQAKGSSKYKHPTRERERETVWPFFNLLELVWSYFGVRKFLKRSFGQNIGHCILNIEHRTLKLSSIMTNHCLVSEKLIYMGAAGKICICCKENLLGNSWQSDI